MLKLILILAATLPLISSTNSSQNIEGNGTRGIHPDGLTLRTFAHYFTNMSDFLLNEFQQTYDAIEYEVFFVSSKNTKNDIVSGCKQINTTLQCKKVDIFEAAEDISTEITHVHIIDSPVQILRTPIFVHLANLTVLELSNNSIQYVTSKLFYGLQQLLLLNLSSNHIRALTKQAFVGCPNLRTIDLSNNRIISLKFIPAAFSSLSNLTTLILSYNNIRQIKKKNLIPLNDSPIQTLDLKFCNLHLIEREAFGQLRNLQNLNLDGNSLEELSLVNVTSNLASIRFLHLKALLSLKGFPRFAMSALENSSIKLLDFYKSRLHSLPNNSFSFLPELIYLRLADCEIKYIEEKAFDGVNSLEILDLSLNYLIEVPAGIGNLNNLKILYLNSQRLDFKLSFKIPEYAFSNLSSLTGLVLTSNYVNKILRYHLHNLVNLRVLLMPSCKISTIFDNSFRTLASLEMLDLSNNRIFYLANNTFAGLRNLKVLSVRNNEFFLPYRALPFTHTHSLEKLLISHNKMRTLRPGIFSKMPNLKILEAQNNEIIPWNYSIFEKTTQPERFLLSSNQIDRISPIMLDDIEEIDYIDLSVNPFDCHYCYLNDFRQWLRNNENKSLSNPLMYICSSPKRFDGQSLMNLEDQFQHCLPEDVINIINISVGMVALIVLLIISISLIVRFKWYFRYMCFHFHSTFRRYSASSVANNYQYDAFVSYNSVDVAWVAQILMPNVEGHRSDLRLCIHDRDFEVGKLITDNILESIDKSRKVVLVLTDSFVKSQWCMYELHVAQHQLFHHNRDALVFVQVGPIDRSCMSKNLKYLLKTRTYLIWPDDSDKRTEFWNRLFRILTT